ncbi:MAG: leucine-rich repeat protein [Mycoplasma sp.]|nr:leucine-rich repeat protein [Mycoplasma sp.]
MNVTKLLKSILIPTLGISAIVSIAAVSTSCGSENENKQYQCVVLNANADSTLTLNNGGENNPNLQYSTDGKSWSTYSSELNINQGQTLYLKGNNPTGWSKSNTNYSYLSITGDVSISGDVMALLDNGAKSVEEGDITAIPCDYCFYDLFRNSTGITSVSEDFLPATNLKQDCYDGMFYQCTSLTNAPKLSSRSLAVSCYQHMFNGCTSLTVAPELPATNLAEKCYRTMFKNCTALTTAPNLPATSLANNCYDWMFQNCSSLSTAPELPATTLAENCYYGMFNSCTALTTAPELPATSLVSGCYGRIFDGCSSLNSIKIGYLGNYDSTYFNSWVTGVASSGTFYYNGSQTAQDFQLPSGWKLPSKSYVIITTNENSTFELVNKGASNPNLEYSTDGINWRTYSSTLNILQDSTLYLKGNNPNGWSTSNSIYSHLSIKGNVSVSGNVMALLDNAAKSGEEGDITDIPCNYCFYDLFRDSTGITSVSEDFLPATTLTNYCYSWMFDGCSSLTVAPELPATSLKNGCYDDMFYRCTSLVTAPELPATNLKESCYDDMFYKCSKLNSIKIGYIGNYDSTYFDSWVTGVASSGTFYYNGTTQTAQDFGLPSGWTTEHF